MSTEARLVELAKDIKADVAAFTGALATYTVTSDTQFAWLLRSCRGREYTAKVEALLSTYKPQRIDGRTFYVLLGGLAMAVDEMHTFKAGWKDVDYQEALPDYRREVARWRAIVTQALPLVKDCSYRQRVNRTVDGLHFRFNHDCLSMAILAQDTELLKFVASHGAKVDNTYIEDDVHNGTLLHLFVSIVHAPRAEVARCLIDLGVDPNRLDSKQQKASYYLLRSIHWRNPAIRATGYTESDMQRTIDMVLGAENA